MLGLPEYTSIGQRGHDPAGVSGAVLSLARSESFWYHAHRPGDARSDAGRSRAPIGLDEGAPEDPWWQRQTSRRFGSGTRATSGAAARIGASPRSASTSPSRTAA